MLINQLDELIYKDALKLFCGQEYDYNDAL